MNSFHSGKEDVYHSLDSTMDGKPKENWGSGGPYEQYVGRWSRKIAKEFLGRLGVSAGQKWSDVGCGTGALIDMILAEFNPQSIAAIDRSEGFVAEARRRIADSRVRFEVGDATALPWPSESCDVSVSGLVLNFVSDPDRMAIEMARVTRPGGKVAIYVWDYAGGMQMMRHFWDAAVELNSNDAALDQAERYPLCEPEPLEALFRRAGLTTISVRPIDIPTVFRDFDDYWIPFLGKQGAAPTYLASLSEEMRSHTRCLEDSARSECRWIHCPDCEGVGSPGKSSDQIRAVSNLSSTCWTSGRKPAYLLKSTGESEVQPHL